MKRFACIDYKEIAMDEISLRSFFSQFAASQRNINKWPTWMQESTKVASASFPKPNASSGRVRVETNSSGGHRSKDKQFLSK